MKEAIFPGKYGSKLFSRTWEPEGTARAVVVVVHGFKAHSGLYEWPAAQLTQIGICVHAFDLRGHGRSEGERYHVDKFSDYVADLSTFVSIAEAEHPGLPLFVLGHSAGGVVGCLFALDEPRRLAGFICEDFSYALPPPDVALSLLKGISHLAPHAHLLNLKEEDFSRDPAFVEKLKADPLGNQIPGTVQLLAELIRADERLKQSFSQITVPLLILHGTGDRVAKSAGSQYFYDHAGSVDKTLKLYEGHYHDMLNDLGREKVMADVIEWLKPRIG